MQMNSCVGFLAALGIVFHYSPIVFAAGPGAPPLVLPNSCAAVALSTMSGRGAGFVEVEVSVLARPEIKSLIDGGAPNQGGRKSPVSVVRDMGLLEVDEAQAAGAKQRLEVYFKIRYPDSPEIVEHKERMST